jgi:hypothetical protein
MTDPRNQDGKMPVENDPDADRIPDQIPDRLSAKVRLNAADAADAESGGATGKVMPLPGMVAIGLYMLMLAAILTFRVVSGQVAPLFLILAPFFVTASFGLLRMFRWAWALTLAAVFLLSAYSFWGFFEQRQAPGAVQGILNLVFFMYLVRIDVRSRLR